MTPSSAICGVTARVTSGSRARCLHARRAVGAGTDDGRFVVEHEKSGFARSETAPCAARGHEPRHIGYAQPVDGSRDEPGAPAVWALFWASNSQSSDWVLGRSVDLDHAGVDLHLTVQRGRDGVEIGETRFGRSGKSLT